MYFSRSRSSNEEIQEIIDTRLKMMDKMYERRKDFILNWDTDNGGNLEIYDNDVYGLNDSQDALYKVNTMEAIGWNDPFPKDIPQS